MDLKKLSPWNWLKSENSAQTPTTVEPRPAEMPMLALDRDIDRLMGQMLRNFGFPSLFDQQASRGTLLQPSIDIIERDAEYVVKVEVPGISEDDLKLSLDHHRLLIEGEKKRESEDRQERYHRIERVYGSFRRVLDLPEDALSADIKASFKDGILTVSVPRDADAVSSRRQIAIEKG